MIKLNITNFVRLKNKYIVYLTCLISHLKKIIERSVLYNHATKLLMKKFINDTDVFYLFDSCKRNFTLNTMGYLVSSIQRE